MANTSTPAAKDTITVKLFPNFDPAAHGPAVIKKAETLHGPGWVLEHFDPATHSATLTRLRAVTEVTAGNDTDSLTVSLARSTKPSDGDKVASKLEDQHPGYRLTCRPFCRRP